MNTCAVIEALQSRFSSLPSQCSAEQPMFDAQGREYLVVYRTLPTSLDGKYGAIASNLPDFRLNKDYLQDFQARDLSASGESSKIRQIASKLDPTRLLVASGDATIGTPVVWTSPQGKSYVLGGNGRTIAFLIASNERYKDYVNEATQRWFNVYDTKEKQGYRNLLVRDVFHVDGSPLSLEDAIKLAGASQESTAGKETPLRQALSRARGMGITKETDLGAISFPMDLTPYTVDKFVEKNIDFWEKVKSLVPNYIASQLSNIDDKTKPIAYDVITSVLVGRYLPTKIVQEGFGSDKEEEAIIGVLPSLVSLQQQIDEGYIFPQYNLLNKLETARQFMNMYRWKSYGNALNDYNRECKLQSSLLEPSPVCSMNKLGVAFGLYLKRMVQACDASAGAKDVNKYIEGAAEDNPNMIGMFGEKEPQEIEEEATALFTKLCLPAKLGQTLMEQNPRRNPSSDSIIIEALADRFLSLEEGSKPEEEALSLKPYRTAPSVSDVIFDHDADGTIIEYNTRLDKDVYSQFVNKLGHRTWNKSYGDSGLRPSPKAKRANAGEDHPQQWFISQWTNGARYLLKNGLQVFVYEAIDPRLDNSYLLEDEDDLDNLIAHLNKQIKEEQAEKTFIADTSKEIVLSNDFPICRYMKGILRKYAYASASYEAKKMQCPEGTFLVEQNPPVERSNYVYTYISDIKKDDTDQPFYKSIFRLATGYLYEGQRGTNNPIYSSFYIKLITTYYETLGYEVCRTNIKGGRSDSGIFMIYLESNEELSESGFGTRDVKPIAYIPFPTKLDIEYFTETNVPKWTEKALAKESKTFVDVKQYMSNKFSFPVSSLLTFQVNDDGSVSYFYSFEVLGIFQLNVIRYKGESPIVFTSIGRQGIKEYPNISVTTDQDEMDLIDKCLNACKEVSKEYIKEKEALDSKEASKPKRKEKKKDTVTIYKEDGTSFEREIVAGTQGKKFTLIKQGEAGEYSYPYKLVYIPTGQLITISSGLGGSQTIAFAKLGKAKKVWKALEEHFIAPREYPRGYEIDAYHNKNEDKIFTEELASVVAKHTDNSLQRSMWHN